MAGHRQIKPPHPTVGLAQLVSAGAGGFRPQVVDGEGGVEAGEAGNAALTALGRRRTGRPLKLDAELIEDFDALLSAGCYVETTCDALGVSTASYHAWRNRGEAAWQAREQGGSVGEGDMVFLDFFEAIRRALARGEAVAVTLLSMAGEVDWRAAAKFLEMRYRDRYTDSKGRVSEEQIAKVGNICVELIDEFVAESRRDEAGTWLSERLSGLS